MLWICYPQHRKCSCKYSPLPTLVSRLSFDSTQPPFVSCTPSRFLTLVTRVSPRSRPPILLASLFILPLPHSLRFLLGLHPSLSRLAAKPSTLLVVRRKCLPLASGSHATAHEERGGHWDTFAGWGIGPHRGERGKVTYMGLESLRWSGRLAKVRGWGHRIA